MTVFVWVPDLMDRSKVLAALRGAVVVADAAAAACGPGDVVVMDLARPEAVTAVGALRATGARVVGFSGHVDRGRMEEARAAGCEVHARSAFFGRIAALVG